MPPADGPDLLPQLQRNRDAVLKRMAEAALRAGRDPSSLELVAVTKTVSPELALALAEIGQRDLGENRLDGLEQKTAYFSETASAAPAVRWHFVGHLQRNKARRVARLAHAIHAVDTPALLATLERIAAEEGLRPWLYLQVKLTDEPTKHGLEPAQVPELVARAAEHKSALAGLMTMAPLAGGRAAARRTFERLAALAAELPAEAFAHGAPRLSMGMSADLEEAVAAGADTLRIGTAFFEGLEAAA